MRYLHVWLSGSVFRCQAILIPNETESMYAKRTDVKLGTSVAQSEYWSVLFVPVIYFFAFSIV